MTCPCDQPAAPAVASVAPGLASLPPHDLGFPELRDALLRAAAAHPSLRGWRGRGDDFGLMLLEWWSYVGDVLAFYNRVLAGEAFVRTAKDRASLRRLTGLLGYLPRPAVAAVVELAISIDGRRPLDLPTGLQFRSGAFGDEPPQLFESLEDERAHADLNGWSVLPAPPATLSGTLSYLDLEPGTARVFPGVPLLIKLDQHHIRTATSVTSFDDEGRRLVRVHLDRSIALASPVALSAARLYAPSNRTSLWRLAAQTGDPAAIAEEGGKTLLVLESLNRNIQAGEWIIVSRAGDHRGFLVEERSEPQLVVTPAFKLKVGSQDVDVPAARTPVTRLRLDAKLDDRKPPGGATWGTGDAGKTLVYFDPVEAGRITAPRSHGLSPGDTLHLAGVRLQLGSSPAASRFLIQGSDERGVASAGLLDWSDRTIQLAPGTTWSPPLELPARVYGNVALASRGETVEREVLGSGDARVPWQRFTLAKSPLTYLPAPAVGSDSGVKSTLVVSVNGVRWTEVPSFYGQAPDAQVYIVRQDDAGKSHVTFGDGKRGARVPSGVDNVVARYRFGAGAAAPPAGSITQLVKPVPGLRRVDNPVAAAGGADAETGDELRGRAPQSALLLGRAVSIQDFQVVALGVAGVTAASAEWRWSDVAQRPVVHVCFVGAQALAPAITARLRALSDPSTPIFVEASTPIATAVVIDVATDPRRVAADVASAVKQHLVAAVLVPGRLGIGAPVYRSQLFAEILGIPGATGVRSVVWGAAPFTAPALSPGAGHHFDVEGRITVKGTIDGNA